ncbi:MAG: ThiF family adenylyltransferase [Candidatus Reddybacter sp.]
MLFRRLHIDVDGLEGSDRYIALEFIPFEESWISESSPTHIDFNIAPLRELFRRCEEEKLVFGFVHNHPTGLTEFSETDDKNELTLLNALLNRNGVDISFVAMLWANEKWAARIRHGETPNRSIPVRHTMVVSDRLEMHGFNQSSADHARIQARQASAFGLPFVDMLQSLRICIVGCGGTGSPLATLMARAGINELILIDSDTLEHSNLNRVRGSTFADIGKHKATILKNHIDGMGLPVNVVDIIDEIDASPVALDALASCDVVFGCTDDFAGREVMNVALYIYAQAFIDLGLGGRVAEGGDGMPVLRHHFGRVSTILPESGQCLFCQQVISQDWVRTQLALRENPNMSEAEAKERYLVGGGDEAPGVGPFTGATADFAVATLFDLIKPYRRFPPEVRKDMFLIDFVQMDISSRATEVNDKCAYCQSRNFLLMKEGDRLQRPFLGKRDEYN